jgi:hypothetical protein
MNHTQTLHRLPFNEANRAMIERIVETVHATTPAPPIHALRSGDDMEIRPLFSVPRVTFDILILRINAAIEAIEAIEEGRCPECHGVQDGHALTCSKLWKK